MIIDAKSYAGECACGKNHEIATELCIIESGCLKKSDQYIKEFGIEGKCAAVYDENTYAATEGCRPTADLEIILPAENLHANEHGVDLLLERLPDGFDYLLAVGSGTIHDIVRYCAYIKGLKFVSCPTAASVDGFCSSVAAMTWGGCKKTLTAVAPSLVLADLDIISKAPFFLARSGFGDMIGKKTALCDWKLAHLIQDEFFCPRIHDLTEDATDAIIEASRGLAEGDEGAYALLIKGLLLSGIAMQLMGNSRPASGAEHHISHFIETAPAHLGISSDALHGEKVGVGTLLVCREYRRIAALDASDFGEYPEMTEEYLKSVFGDEMGAQLVKENEVESVFPNTMESLRAHWDEAKELLLALPTYESLKELYDSLGVMSTLADLGISDDKEALALDCSPCIRNRLTFMRLRRALKR